VAGTVLLLGAVGQLQFEVVAHRLEHEYGVKARVMPARYNVARWVTCPMPRSCKRFIDGNAHRVAYDAVDAPALHRRPGQEGGQHALHLRQSRSRPARRRRRSRPGCAPRGRWRCRRCVVVAHDPVAAGQVAVQHAQQARDSAT
jgi:hypothetical protein